MLGLVVLTALPLLATLAMSFTNFTGYNLGTLKFVGLTNYATAFTDGDALWSLGRTGIFMLVYVPTSLIISLAMAIILTQKIYAQGVFRTLFYIPSILPIVAVIWIWKMMMDNNFGLVNTILDFIKPGTYIRWMTDYPTQVLIMMMVWSGIGGGVLIFMAALQGVPSELEEAARIDGAGFFNVIRHVKMPLITPVIYYQLILGIIGALQVLIQPMLLSSLSPSTGGVGSGGGGLSSIPVRPNLMYTVYAFEQIMSNQNYGYGSALLWIMFVVILILTLIVVRTSHLWVYYEVEQEGPQS
jgi:multiple sugar transport system permease protein